LEDFYRSALPRIKCGSYFATRQEDLIFGTFLLEKHDLEIYQSLTSEYQDAAIAVADGLAACNNENEIAGLLKKTAETISDRKEFYRTLYMLLTGKSQGPKLSTLLSLAGAQTIMNLIKGESGYAK
jgi:lysyl-tRNA synthetase class I